MNNGKNKIKKFKSDTIEPKHEGVCYPTEVHPMSASNMSTNVEGCNCTGISYDLTAPQVFVSSPGIRSKTNYDQLKGFDDETGIGEDVPSEVHKLVTSNKDTEGDENRLEKGRNTGAPLSDWESTPSDEENEAKCDFELQYQLPWKKGYSKDDKYSDKFANNVAESISYIQSEGDLCSDKTAEFGYEVPQRSISDSNLFDYKKAELEENFAESNYSDDDYSDDDIIYLPASSAPKEKVQPTANCSPAGVMSIEIFDGEFESLEEMIKIICLEEKEVELTETLEEISNEEKNECSLNKTKDKVEKAEVKAKDKAEKYEGKAKDKVEKSEVKTEGKFDEKPGGKVEVKAKAKVKRDSSKVKPKVESDNTSDNTTINKERVVPPVSAIPTIKDILEEEKSKLKVDPTAIKKIVLVECPLTSFKHLDVFSELVEVFITDSPLITEVNWSDFAAMQKLKTLAIHGNSISRIEKLRYPDLTHLMLARNCLKSLNFISSELSSLKNLNVAQNEITHLEESTMLALGNLEVLNLAGNPLCTIHDIEAIKCCKNLKNLKLKCYINGSCPVMKLGTCHNICSQINPHISTINNVEVTDAERSVGEMYRHNQMISYYASTVTISAAHVEFRQQSRFAATKQLDGISKRMVKVVNLLAKYRRAMEVLNSPSFSASKMSMSGEITKLELRLLRLKEWTFSVLKRLAIITQISYWEEQVEKWSKWIECQSYGSTKCQLGLSVVGDTMETSADLRSTVHKLLTSLLCTLVPPDTDMKVESIFTLSDNCVNEGLSFYHTKEVNKEYLTAFVPPPPEIMEKYRELKTYKCGDFFFYADPSFDPDNIIEVDSYLPSDFVPSIPKLPFPQSFSGHSEHRQPIFLYLMPDARNRLNPIHYLHKYLTGETRHSKDLRLTNCMWTAIQGNHDLDPPEFAVLIVMKVVDEFLQVTSTKKRLLTGCEDSHDCAVYSLTTSLAATPAYILSVSFSKDYKDAWWLSAGENDKDVLITSKKILDNLCISNDNPTQVYHKLAASSFLRSIHTLSSYVRRVWDGTHADLAAIEDEINKERDKHLQSTSNPEMVTKEYAHFSLSNISQVLGNPTAKSLTSLDVSGNRIGVSLGLDGLDNLKRLNLAHNNLTTLSGINRLPHLIELKVSCNYLRFLISNLTTLSWATPNLQILEILPNPFQDIRDILHIPILLSKVLPKLNKVDVWEAPFNSGSLAYAQNPPDVVETLLSQDAMEKTAMNSCYSYNALSSSCLIDLESLPKQPPFPIGFSNAGMDLDLSNNYLTSMSLYGSYIATINEWINSLVKLQIQRNLITHLGWMKQTVFPNLQMLNLCDNTLRDVSEISESCPMLRHLFLSHNPLPCELSVLDKLKPIGDTLLALDCSGSPLTQHPTYHLHVSVTFPFLKILDGENTFKGATITKSWQEDVNKLGGELNTKWLLNAFGGDAWENLTQLSLPKCGLRKICLPEGSMHNLMNLNVRDNYLSTLSGLSRLPNLRVLTASFNNITTLGKQPPFNMCHEYIQYGQPKESSLSAENLDYVRVHWPEEYESFPKLEVLVLSHNSIKGIGDLQLQSLPKLSTLILNCNEITNAEEFSNMKAVTAIVLDNNKIGSVSPNAFEQCNELRYLHMDHNFLTALPRLPHLNSLQSLHLAYNRIQKLADVPCLTSGSMVNLKELSVEGNPLATKHGSEYSLAVVKSLPSLVSLDGNNLNQEQVNVRAKGNSTLTKAENSKNIIDSSGEACIAEDIPCAVAIRSISSEVGNFQKH